MPYISKEQRAQGGWVNRVKDPHGGGPCDCDWSDPRNWNAETLAHRALPVPDQSRYGQAKDDG